MIISDDIVSSIDRDGWSVFNTGIDKPIDLKRWMLAVGKQLGEVCPSRRGSEVVDVLVPTIESKSKPSSLSRVFGLGSLPLHCDTAHWTTPCRYIVLGCINPGSSPAATLILDTKRLALSTKDRETIEQAMYVVNNGRNSFYSGIKSSLHPFYRFDPVCMIPLCENAVRAMELFSLKRNENLVERCNWKVGIVLVIDNWRILHGREQCPVDEDERKLLRITVQ